MVRDELSTSAFEEISIGNDESVSVDVWNVMIGAGVWLSDVAGLAVVVTVIVVGLTVVPVTAYAHAKTAINPSMMVSFIFTLDHVAAATPDPRFM